MRKSTDTELDRQIETILVDFDLAEASPGIKELLEKESRKSLHLKIALTQLKQLIARERLDELNHIKFIYADGTENFAPFAMYRCTKDGLLVSWEERQAELQAQADKEPVCGYCSGPHDTEGCPMRPFPSEIEEAEL